MNFSSPATFPDFPGFHLALYPLANADSSTEDVEKSRAKLAEIMRTYPENITFINARYVACLFHVHIAVARAILNTRTAQLKTNTFANEVIYHMYPTHSIKESFEKYGLKNADRQVFALIFNVSLEGGSMSKRMIDELKGKISEALGTGECEDLSQHIESQDIDKIAKIFEVKDNERTLTENGFLNSIYSKLALKNM